MPKQKDLFDDSQMSFGDHLEELRKHLIRALIGLAIGVTISMIFGQSIVAVVRKPIEAALLRAKDNIDPDIKLKDFGQKSPYDYFMAWLSSKELETNEDGSVIEEPTFINPESSSIELRLNAKQLTEQLHKVDPKIYPKPENIPEDLELKLSAKSDDFKMFKNEFMQSAKPIVLNVQEGFMTYLKVSLVAGLVLSSPWVFYQGWLFVAVGLYDHERKYVYIYGFISFFLFMLGAVFCFYLVFPIVLDFLLAFSYSLEATPQIRLSEWISFAILLPVMFGISFQLPLVMLFMERLSIFEAKNFREQRRMAILIIAILSMFLTPAEPFSMVLMMIPLILLYELGILLCEHSPSASPFENHSVT